MLKICNECGFSQEEFLKIGGVNYCKGCNAVISSGNIKMLDSVTLSAYDKKAIYNIFRLTIKGTEKYIEASGCYSDWENRRQVRDNTEGFSNPKEAEESLVVALFGFKAALKDTPPFLQGELKSEFCSWVDATGINVGNCRDERLKHILFEINEIIEGNGDRLAKESASWAHEGVKKMSDEEFSKKMNEGFIGIQSPLNSERKIAKSLVGKTYKDVESEKMFNGNSEKGERSLDLIVKDVSNKHEGFHFFPPQEQQIRNPNYNPLIDDPSEEFLNLDRGDEMDVDEDDNSIRHYQKNDQSVSGKVDNSTTSDSNNSGLGTVVIIGGVLVVAILGIYGVVKKSKKVKK